MLKKVLLATVSALVALGTVELWLRWAASRTQYLDYGDVYRKEGLGPGGFLREGFRGMVQDGYGGRVLWINNLQGFRSEFEFDIPAPEGTFRILSLGDSFTGGYRVGQDQTFSALVERQLGQRHPDAKIEVLVSVIEDPLTGLYYLASRGHSYRPDLVVLGITLGNDVAQIYALMDQQFALRSEPPFVEQLDENPAHSAWVDQLTACTIPADCLMPRGPGGGGKRQGPAWSDIYPWWYRNQPQIVSLALRLRRRFLLEAPQTVVSNWEEYEQPRLFDSNGLGIMLRDPPAEVNTAYQQLFQTLGAYGEFCRTHGLRLLVVIFPQRFQVQESDWQKTLEVYALREACFDRERPQREILASCLSQGIDCLDPTESMRTVHRRGDGSLYLPNHDMHWNAAGHAALASALIPKLDSLLRSKQK